MPPEQRAASILLLWQRLAYEGMKGILRWAYGEMKRILHWAYGEMKRILRWAYVGMKGILARQVHRA
jgi:hypothetical protein